MLLEDALWWTLAPVGRGLALDHMCFNFLSGTGLYFFLQQVQWLDQLIKFEADTKPHTCSNNATLHCCETTKISEFCKSVKQTLDSKPNQPLFYSCSNLIRLQNWWTASDVTCVECEVRVRVSYLTMVRHHYYIDTVMQVSQFQAIH